MILADKIIRLRKKNGWSQEELADKMHVSRQAVSKWEGAQTVPDLERVLQLSSLFGVTTDYLLKDDMEDEEFTDSETESGVKRITLEDAHQYLELRKTAARYISVATFLCIISPIALILLGVQSETPDSGLRISEDMAGILGLVVLFILVAIAVAMYVLCGFRNEPYEYLEKEPFETEYGVTGMVREKQKEYRSTYTMTNIIGTCICILSPVSLIAGAFSENEVLLSVLLSIMLILVGIGVMLFIYTGVQWASMQKLLQEGDYTPKGKPGNQRKDRLKESIGSVYWLFATAVYLCWSFVSSRWEITWVVWPVAAVLFAAVMAICDLFGDKE